MSAESAATEAATEVVETVTENAGKIIGAAAAIAGAALATWWIVNRVGAAAQNAADQSGIFDPPTPMPVAPALYLNAGDDDQADDDHADHVWGDHRPAGAEFMGG